MNFVHPRDLEGKTTHELAVLAARALTLPEPQKGYDDAVEIAYLIQRAYVAARDRAQQARWAEMEWQKAYVASQEKLGRKVLL